MTLYNTIIQTPCPGCGTPIIHGLMGIGRCLECGSPSSQCNSKNHGFHILVMAAVKELLDQGIARFRTQSITRKLVAGGMPRDMITNRLVAAALSLHRHELSLNLDSPRGFYVPYVWSKGLKPTIALGSPKEKIEYAT